MVSLDIESNILHRNYNSNLGLKIFKGKDDATGAPPENVRYCSYIAHFVPYFLKEPALSVFLLNE